MSDTSTFGRWHLTFRFPPGCNIQHAKQWARQTCLGVKPEEPFECLVGRLTKPKIAKKYQGLVVGIKDMQGQKRQWELEGASRQAKVW